MYRWVRRHYQFQLRGRRFLEAPWSGGLVLLISVAVAMLLANLPLTADGYQRLLNIDIALVVRGSGGMIDWMFPRGLTLQTFVNDGLMVVFFFLIGLEIKREIVVGQLSSVKKAILPVLAALGGMVVPALIYFSFNAGTVAAPGWGIPTATDIAFAIGILSIFSDRVPISLKIFLTALAVADDLGAILVIALFYGEEVNLLLLAIAILILIGIYFLNKVGETRIMFYLVPAFVVWALFYYSGIHSTLSGVVIAMFIPMKPRYSKEYFARKMTGLSDALLKAECRADDFPNEEHRHYLRMMSSLATDSVGMSYRLEHLLAPYVTFLIMPIFAFANAGVSIDSLEYFRIFHVTPPGRCGRHGCLLRTARRQAARYFPGQLACREDETGRNARGSRLEDALRRGMPGRYRVHHVDFRRYAGLCRCRDRQPGQDCHSDGIVRVGRIGYGPDFPLFQEKDTYMKKYRLIAAAGLFLLGACSRGTGSVELRNETDSVAYVIGLNVGYNLQRMDSTLNVEAVCQAVRDVYARTARMTPDQARAVYLRYVNVSQPEQIRAYEEQFLEDFRKSNRSYAKTDTGLTYEVLEVGDESKTPRSDRDTVAIRFTAKTVDGKVVESSYERGDTTRMAVGDLMPGLRQSVRLVGKGGRMNVWIPSRLAYGAEGDKKLGVAPNTTLFYEIELVDIR